MTLHNGSRPRPSISSIRMRPCSGCPTTGRCYVIFLLASPTGAFAFQIPSATFATVRELIFDISHQTQWDHRMNGPRTILTMKTSEFDYDTLTDASASLDIWETEYTHVLDSKSAIVDWISSTGLRPFLDALDTDVQRTAFSSELQRRVDEAYETRPDGKVLFPFRRTFVIAYREANSSASPSTRPSHASR